MDGWDWIEKSSQGPRIYEEFTSIGILFWVFFRVAAGNLMIFNLAALLPLPARPTTTTRPAAILIYFMLCL